MSRNALRVAVSTCSVACASCVSVPLGEPVVHEVTCDQRAMPEWSIVCVTMRNADVGKSAADARLYLQDSEAVVCEVPNSRQIEVVGPIEDVLFVVEVLWRLDQSEPPIEKIR